MKALGLASVFGVLLALALSCAGGPRPVSAPVPALAPDSVAWTLLLIGDAGAPGDHDPVLAALVSAAAAAPARTTVVFLGDNVYPAGLPDSADATRAEEERRLARQLDVFRGSGARGFLIPGNHDWVKGAAAGWEAVRRQDRFVDRYAGNLADLLPGDGCPGPAVRDLGPPAGFRLVLLDSQWWLQGGPRPVEGSACGRDTRGEVTAGLRDALATAGDRPVIVMTHHPAVSGGAHGGHFTFAQHVFPLTEMASWAWLPLPLVGSLYPLARTLGISPQDVSSGGYATLLDSLRTAMADHPPLALASGHEHTLQVIEAGPARYQLVSGTGYANHHDRVGWIAGTRYASSMAGFLRLDLLPDGRVRLGVMEVDEGGRAGEAWSTWLRAAPRAESPAGRVP